MKRANNKHCWHDQLHTVSIIECTCMLACICTLLYTLRAIKYISCAYHPSKKHLCCVITNGTANMHTSSNCCVKANAKQSQADLDGASKYSVPLMTTRWAGVLTPQARVEVATRIWILPATKRRSQVVLSPSVRPA